MAVIEPAGLPAVRLAPLLKARRLDPLADEDICALHAPIDDPARPTPRSPHCSTPSAHPLRRHTHSTAILAWSIRKVPSCSAASLRRDAGFVPYIEPGFDLAEAAADVFQADPSVDGLILDKHGIFTFGDVRASAYDRIIAARHRGRASVAAHAHKTPVSVWPCPPAWRPRSDLAAFARRVAVPRGEGCFDRMINVSAAPMQRSPSSTAPISPTAGAAAYRRRTCRTGQDRASVLPPPDADHLGHYTVTRCRRGIGSSMVRLTSSSASLSSK